MLLKIAVPKKLTKSLKNSGKKASFLARRPYSHCQTKRQLDIFGGW